MCFGKSKESLPSLFDSGPYRSSNSEHLRSEPTRGRKHGTPKIGKEWTAGFRTRTWVHGNVLRLRASGREGIASSSSPIFRARRQLPRYGRGLRSIQKRGIAGTFFARGSSRQRRRRDKVWVPYKSRRNTRRR